MCVKKTSQKKRLKTDLVVCPTYGQHCSIGHKTREQYEPKIVVCPYKKHIPIGQMTFSLVLETYLVQA